MSWMPVAVDHWVERRSSEQAANLEIPARLWIAAVVLRTVFLVLLLVVTVQVSLPQSSTIWTAYETPGDLVRLALGFGVCLWIAIQAFILPKDIHAYRTWLYLGLAVVPFAVIWIVGIW